MSNPRSRNSSGSCPGLLLIPALAVALLGAAPHTQAAAAHPAGRSAASHHQAITFVAKSFTVIGSGAAVVTNCSSYSAAGGLGAALAAGNAITFACNPATSGAKVGGKYVIMVPQTASPAISITGATLSIDGSDGGANDVAIDGGSTSATTGVQIFFADSTSSLTLSNLTLQNGYASNGVVIGVGTDSGNGGAVEAQGNFTATNVTFMNNKAQLNGGAVELGAGNVAGVTDTITNSTFTNNTADLAKAGAGGGAVDVDNPGRPNPQMVTISQSTFTGNSTTAGGAGLGGAILSSNDHPAIVSIGQSVFSGNTADGEGGGVDNDADTMTITDSQFTNNTATTGPGGGVAVETSNGTTVLRSSFIGNKATAGHGGGFYLNETGNPAQVNSLANSTFSANSATDGGGIYNNSGTITLVADTIAANTATAAAPAAGGVTNAGLAVNSQSTIVSNNLGAAGVVNCNGALSETLSAPNSFNLEYSGAAANTCGFTNGTNGDITGSDPLLSPPANNGSPVVGVTLGMAGLQTMALGLGSKAIGGVTTASVCTAAPVSGVDNRSLPRYAAIRHVCDIGAFDTGGGIVPPMTVTGAIPLTTGVPARLGFAASNHSAFTPLTTMPGGATLSPFNIGYITFQKGAASFVVRQLVALTCTSANVALAPNHCVGTIGLVGGVPTFILVPGVATLTLSGTISSSWGGVYPLGAKVTVTLTISASATGVVTVSSVTVTVAGVPGSTVWNAPFPFGTKIQFGGMTTTPPALIL